MASATRRTGLAIARASRNAIRAASADVTTAATISPCTCGRHAEFVELAGRKQHEPLASNEPGGVQVPRSVRLDRPVEPRSTAQSRSAVGREQRRRAVQRDLLDPLILAVEEILERLKPREGQDRVAFALHEEVELSRDVTHRVPLDRPARQHGPERECERHREQGDERDRGEQPRAQGRQLHGRMAL